MSPFMRPLWCEVCWLHEFAVDVQTSTPKRQRIHSTASMDFVPFGGLRFGRYRPSYTRGTHACM